MPLGERACAIRRCRTPKPPAPVSALLAAILVWVAFVGLGPVAAASASTPNMPHAVVLSAGARPSSLPAGGGTVTVTGRVRHATSCQLRLLSAQPFPVVYSHNPTSACASGNYLAQVTIGTNTGKKQRVVAFDIVARNSTSASSGWFGVTILGAPSAVVLSAGAEPRALPAGGGTVTVTGRVRNATSCQLRLLSAQPFPVVYSHDPTGACRSGDYTAHVVIGGNPDPTARTVGFALVARNQSSSFAGPFEVTVAPRPPPTTTTVAQLAMDTQSLPTGTAGRPYYAKLSASGGVPPYHWSTPGGGFPPGLRLTREGVLNGTPTEPGDFTVGLTVSDSAANQTTGYFVLSVNAGHTTATTTTAAPLAITTASMPGGSVGVAYAFRLRATGGDPPYTWSQDGGGLPPGLALTGGGVIKGTPSQSGSYMAGFDATDSSGSSTTAVFTINIGGGSTTTTTVPPTTTTTAPAEATSISVSLSLSSSAGSLSTSLDVDYTATPSASCDFSDGSSGPCDLPAGRVSWEIVGGDEGGNFMYPSKALPDCTQPVEADQPSSECDVAWSTYGDQELQATYTSSPSSELEGQITVPETLWVQIEAPVDLAAGNTYNSYGNTGPSAINDCTMAAAADWIETTFGTTPSDQEVVGDYWAAEGEFNDGADVGLSTTDLFEYWQADGIGGTTLTGVEPISASDVESELSQNYVLLSQVTLPSGYPLGDGEGGRHLWIVVGYSGYGPMVVTWGQEVQISWADFDDWTTGIWGIGASQG